MSKNYVIDIHPSSDLGTVEFELLKKSTSEYWKYTATRYTGPVGMIVEYLVNEDLSGYPVGAVSAEMDPKNGIVWNYTNYPHGTLDGHTKSFKKALLKLTKNA